MGNNTLLLHVCCAVDLVYSIKIAKQLFSNVILFFYNPNIHPYQEYLIRLHEVERIAKNERVSLVVGEYDIENWIKQTFVFSLEKEGDKRCLFCHKIILEKSFEIAKHLNIANVSTTLYMSPLKHFENLDKVGSLLEAKYDIKFQNIYFRKNNGYAKTRELVKLFSIYSQSYCGCIWGLFQISKNSEKYLMREYKESYILPGSKEFLELLENLRVLYEPDYKTVLAKVNGVYWDLKRAVLAIDNEFITDFFIKPFSHSMKGRFAIKEVIEDKDITTVKVATDSFKIFLTNNIKIKDYYFNSQPQIYLPLKFKEIFKRGKKVFIDFETSIYDNIPNYSLKIYPKLGDDNLIEKKVNVIYYKNFFGKFNKEKLLQNINRLLSQGYVAELVSRWEYLYE